MAQIRLTYQKPDETEAHDISEEDGDSQILNRSPKNSLVNVTVVDDSLELLTPTILSSRRGSSLSVSSLTNSASTQPRKFSFPAALPSTLLGLESTGMGLLAKRRFSNVSDAVTRKLSHTIGWRSGHAQSREIVVVGKSLCSQYIRSRLKRSGYLSRKCGLQRLRSAIGSPSGVIFREVYPELLGLGVELERLHPKLYANVSRQASSVPGGKLTSEKEAGTILTAVSRELLKNELTWGKIVSLYAVAGGLAVDCARQGHYDYMSSIVEAMEEILEEELTHWIQYKGGWAINHCLVRKGLPDGKNNGPLKENRSDSVCVSGMLISHSNTQCLQLQTRTKQHNFIQRLFSTFKCYLDLTFYDLGVSVVKNFFSRRSKIS